MPQEKCHCCRFRGYGTDDLHCCADISCLLLPRRTQVVEPDRLLQRVEASLLRSRTHRCSALHAGNGPASPGTTGKMNKIAPAPRVSNQNSPCGCRSRHWQTTLRPCVDHQHASCKLERMRFAGWTLCLDRCNSGLPLDTELRTMTHRPLVVVELLETPAHTKGVEGIRNANHHPAHQCSFEVLRSKTRMVSGWRNHHTKSNC